MAERHRLVEAMEKETDADRLSYLGDVLAVLAARLEPAEAAPIADRLAVVMERKPTLTGSAV